MAPQKLNPMCLYYPVNASNKLLCIKPHLLQQQVQKQHLRVAKPSRNNAFHKE